MQPIFANRQLFKGLRVSNHKVRFSNYLVRASNPLLVIPKKFSAARGRKVRGLAQLIKYAFGRTRLWLSVNMEETLLHMEKSTTIQGKLSQYSLHAFTKNIKLKPTQMKLNLTGSPKFENLASAHGISFLSKSALLKQRYYKAND